MLCTSIPTHWVPGWMWQEVLGGIEGSQLGYIINPQQWFSSFFWCIHPQGPIAMPCPPTAVCAVSIRLSQSSVADPSEIACGAQSEPRSENRVPAPVGCVPPRGAAGCWGGGEAAPAWLSSQGWRWDSPWENPAHPTARHAWELPSAPGFVALRTLRVIFVEKKALFPPRNL